MSSFSGLFSQRLCLKYAVIAVIVTFLLGAIGLTRIQQAKADTQPFVPSFESPQIHPLTITPDGSRLLAVNTPDHRLSVFQLTSGLPILMAEIPVGLEPVSVAARNDHE